MAECVTIGNATLYHGDCLEILPALEGVGVLVTDPPYGIEYASGMGGKFRGVGISGDGSLMARDAALALLPDVPALVFGSWKTPHPSGTKQVLVWDKGPHVGMGDLLLPWRPNTEEVYVIGSGFKGHRGSSVIQINAPSPNFTPNASRHHPTEKPVPLLSALLSKCPPGIVLDPFMGSGTTGVACANLGRDFIGIEIERGYFEIACERISMAQAQGRLFA